MNGLTAYQLCDERGPLEEAVAGAEAKDDGTLRAWATYAAYKHWLNFAKYDKLPYASLASPERDSTISNLNKVAAALRVDASTPIK
jgi:hypothetical protein